MKRRMVWVVMAGLAAIAAGAEEPAAALARGKLEADLGHHAVAAEAFEVGRTGSGGERPATLGSPGAAGCRAA